MSLELGQCKSYLYKPTPDYKTCESYAKLWDAVDVLRAYFDDLFEILCLYQGAVRGGLMRVIVEFYFIDDYLEYCKENNFQSCEYSSFYDI